MTKLYSIVLNPGYNQTDLYSMVSTVTDELLHRSTFFIAECTEEQALALENHEAVKFCQSDEDVPEIEDAVVKRVDYNRDYNYLGMRKTSGTQLTSIGPHPKGNWGLIRHQSQTNNTTFSTDSYSSYSNSYIGDGVDIILQIASVLHPSDPEFMTSGISRLQTSFQWNSLNGMSTLPNVNYMESGVNSHAEAVSYITAGNTYGWATGAKLYIWPRDQMRAANKKLNSHGWDAFKLFHQQKGNSRPTIVVDAIQYLRWHGVPKGSVIFRDSVYSEISPAGAPLTAADRSAIVNSGINAYGNSDTPKFGSVYNLWSTIGNTMDAKNLTDQNKADILAYIEDITNGNYYTTYIQPIEEMSAAGVHHVSAAGNYNNTLVLPDNIDFNNGALSYMSLLVGSNDGSTPQPGYSFVPLCRDDLHLAGDTIVCAALGSQFGVDSGLNNKETLASFTNRGDRVDACAAGDNIYMDLHVNGEYEATGTSFASPNVAGMAACVLGKYPSTTPAQLRKYFRDHAVGTDTLYDSGTQPVPSSPSGDAPYYSDPLGLRGYSGKIAYLDPNLSFNPSTISNTTITSTQTVSASNKINFTVSQINAKLASIS
jgi:hypothetical protein